MTESLRDRAAPGGPPTGDPAAALRARLDPRVLRAFPEIDWLSEVDSTNAWLLARPQRALGVGAVCIADAQLAGRGRRGRTWLSPPQGNLYLSARWRLPPLGAALGGLGLVAGVVAAEAVATLGVPGVRLKWPNDLVCESDGALAKLGGVLVETGGVAGGEVTAVIGIGLNVAPLPAPEREAVTQRVADLQTQAGAPVSRLALAGAVIEGLADALPLFTREGLAGFARRWADLDALAGRAVTVLMADAELQGLAEGLAPDGALRVRCDDGVRTVHAAEVSVRAAS